MDTAGLDFISILTGLFFGVWGFWLIREAKRRAEFSFLFIGIAYLVLPYVISETWMIWTIGLGLGALAYRQR